MADTVPTALELAKAMFAVQCPYWLTNDWDIHAGSNLQAKYLSDAEKILAILKEI